VASSGSKDSGKSVSRNVDTSSLDPLDDDLDDLNFSADDFLPDEDTAKFRRVSPGKKVMGGFLGIFRLPEVLLGKLYRSSFVRAILYRFEWYRDLADQAELGSIIEDTYGGQRGVLSTIRRFIRGNLLFTVLAIAGVYLGGRALLPMVFQHDKVRTVLGHEAFDTEESAKQLTEAKQTAEEILNRRVNLTEELKECIFTDKIHTHILGSIGDTGFLEEESTIKAMATARRYRERVVEAELPKKIDIADGRVALLSAEISSKISVVKQKVAALASQESALRRANAELKQSLASLEARNSSDVNVTNRIIRLRDELNASNQSVRQGPSQDQINKLNGRLDDLANALSGRLDAGYQTIEMVEPYPQWYLSMVNGNDEDAVDAAQKFVERGLDRETGFFADPARAIVNDSVHRLTTITEQAIAGVRRIEASPGEALAELNEEQAAINSQISRVLGEDTTWVDHKPCLQQAGIAIEASE